MRSEVSVGEDDRLQKLGRLTPRQREVLYLASLGLEDREIALKLDRELQTVKNHLSSGYRTLGIGGLTVRSRLIELGSYSADLKPREDSGISSLPLAVSVEPLRTSQLLRIWRNLTRARLAGTLLVIPICLVWLFGSSGFPRMLRANAERPVVLASWRFDEGDGPNAMDLSGNRNMGELFGPVWTSEAKAGAALAFDGGAHVKVNSAASLSASTLTIDLWMKPRLVDGEGQKFVLNKYCYNTPARSEYGLFIENYALVFTTIGVNRLTADLPQANRWYHVVAVADRNDSRIYLDGNLAASGTLAAMVPTPTDLVIGGGAGSRGYCEGPQWRGFSGILDEVSILRRKGSTFSNNSASFSASRTVTSETISLERWVLSYLGLGS
jgi:DNA-binding CsgD family transcriptional regulator